MKDLSEQIKATRGLDREKALKRKIEIWQADGLVNEHGVFVDYEEIEIHRNGVIEWAEIRLAKAPIGYSYGLGYSCSSNGSGYAPSVSRCIAYDSRDEALRAACKELMRLEDYEEARSISHAAHKFLTSLNQPDLFSAILDS